MPAFNYHIPHPTTIKSSESECQAKTCEFILQEEEKLPFVLFPTFSRPDPVYLTVAGYPCLKCDYAIARLMSGLPHPSLHMTCISDSVAGYPCLKSDYANSHDLILISLACHTLKSNLWVGGIIFLIVLFRFSLIWLLPLMINWHTHGNLLCRDKIVAVQAQMLIYRQHLWSYIF